VGLGSGSKSRGRQPGGKCRGPRAGGKCRGRRPGGKCRGRRPGGKCPGQRPAACAKSEPRRAIWRRVRAQRARGAKSAGRCRIWRTVHAGIRCNGPGGRAGGRDGRAGAGAARPITLPSMRRLAAAGTETARESPTRGLQSERRATKGARDGTPAAIADPRGGDLQHAPNQIPAGQSGAESGLSVHVVPNHPGAAGFGARCTLGSGATGRAARDGPGGAGRDGMGGPGQTDHAPFDAPFRRRRPRTDRCRRDDPDAPAATRRPPCGSAQLLPGRTRSALTIAPPRMIRAST
jgi:hypothetical protein